MNSVNNLKRDVINLYQNQPLSTRMFIRTRWLLFDASVLADYVPERGLLVDIGCGHGAWAFYMSFLRPGSEVIGIDIDQRKISVARRVAAARTELNVRFVLGSAQRVSFEAAELVSLLDVLYLIPYRDQEVILAYCVSHLSPGGTLLLKTVDTIPAWKFTWNRLQELIAVNVLRYTSGQNLYFRSATQWKGLLEMLGLRAKITRLDQGYIHPHVLITGRK